MNQSFITGADNPCGVASDGTYLYWGNVGSNDTGKTIGRAKLDGTGVNESFITRRRRCLRVRLRGLTRGPDLGPISRPGGT